MQIKISLIIPIHNRLNITKTGLESLFVALDYYLHHGRKILNIEIVVVDDGSTDGSSDFISKNYPSIHLLKGNGNLWWSGAINEGAKYAILKLQASYVLLWNNDIVPKKNYFIELERVIIENPNAIIGSYIYDYTSKKIWSQGGWFNILNGKRTMQFSKINHTKNVYQWLTGMGTLIPVELINKYGYWDDINFPQYHGDFDFTIRMSKEGVKIVNNDKLIIYNKTEYSSKMGFNIKSYLNSLNEIGSRYNIRKDIMIYRKHCISPLWIISLLKKHIIYFVQTCLK